MINFRVFENQLNKVGEFEERQEAINFARERHAQHMMKYHEVYKIKEGAMPSYGVAQWKPGDCPDCKRPCYVTHNIAEVAVHVCDHCDIEIPWKKDNNFFDADEVYRRLVPCHSDPIILCHVREQPRDCPLHCSKLVLCDELRRGE